MNTQEKIDAIASAFGACGGVKTWKRCTGKYAGTVDYSIIFDNGENLYVCNSCAGPVFDKCVDELYNEYNFNTVQETKTIALNIFRKRSVTDNTIAKQMGLLPYEVRSVEMNIKQENGRMGWYYVVLMVGENIINHVDTGTNYDIRQRELSLNIKNPYFKAGGLKEDEIDYIFHNVGFSSKSPLYKMDKYTFYYKMA
jgi:hypothetical protein